MTHRAKRHAPDVVSVQDVRDMRSFCCLTITMCVVAAVAIVAEKTFHVNGDILFGAAAPTFGASVSSWLRSMLP